MVGVSHGVLHDPAGFVPAQALFVHQDAHQLGDGQAGMGVIDVDGHLIGQQAEVAAEAALEVLDGILQGGAGEEVVLLQAQFLAFVVVVLRIQHLADHGGQLLLLQCLGVVAAVEAVQVDALGGAGAPHAQGVHGFVVIADHGHIVGHGFDGIIILEEIAGPVVDGGFFHMAAEADLAHVLHGGHFPHVAVDQPIVGRFHLLAVDDALAEQAVFITDGAAHGGQAERGQAVQEAGGQTAQAAVAQTGFGLFLQHGAQVHAQLLQGLTVRVVGAQVEHVAVQAAARQKFDGKIIEPLAGGVLILFPVLHPLLHDLVFHGGSQGIINLLGCGVGQGAAVVAL